MGAMNLKMWLAILAMMTAAVQAGVIFEDNFDRSTPPGLGSNWTYGGADPTKAYINANHQLQLDAQGPVSYANAIGFGTPGKTQTIEFNLVQPSPSGDIGCFVNFGVGADYFEYIFDYVSWTPRMYLLSGGNVQYNQVFPDLRGTNAYVVVEVKTADNGSSTASFSAYTDSTENTLIATTGMIATAHLSDGYAGFMLPNDYWSGFIIDNFKITEIPEPASLGILMAMAIGVISARPRRQNGRQKG